MKIDAMIKLSNIRKYYEGEIVETCANCEYDYKMKYCKIDEGVIRCKWCYKNIHIGIKMQSGDIVPLIPWTHTPKKMTKIYRDCLPKKAYKYIIKK